MSILIKGMGMPRHCEDCPFLEFSGDYPYCVATGTQKGYTFIPKLRTERMDSCPLVEIPPHGRLIDADAIQQETDGKLVELQKVIDDDSTWSEERKDAIADVYKIRTAKKWVAWAPTIIEAEEVKE